MGTKSLYTQQPLQNKPAKVSQSRNITSFVFNIIVVALIGLGATLFFISTCYYTFTNTSGDALDQYVISWLGIGGLGTSGGAQVGTMIALVAVSLIIFGYMFFQWSHILRSKNEIHNSKLLSLIIINHVLLLLGVIFINVASPSWKNFIAWMQTGQMTYTGLFTYTIIAVIFFGAGIIFSIVFNHIYYSHSLNILSFAIVYIAMRIVVASVSYYQVENADYRSLIYSINIVADTIATLALWMLFIKLILNQIFNDKSIRYSIGKKITVIFYWVYLALFVISAIITIADIYVDNIKGIIAWFDDLDKYVGFASGILFGGVLTGLAITSSTGIYLQQR